MIGDAIRIRDPIHGSIPLTKAELKVVDHRAFQRLRGVKQLGFTDQAFPGATHTRYAHGLGAMHVASRMFDALLPADGPLAPTEHARLRQLVRLALLLHDLGHAPASHASEPAMPLRGALPLDCYTAEERAQRATHEDYTLAVLLGSDLHEVIGRSFDVDPLDLAHLLGGRHPEQSSHFLIGGVDWLPLLSQMVSGELDADRMDYLQRDAFFAGVTYGRFDQDWLLENLGFHISEDRAHLAMSHRAVFAFEDFLLSRLHMFVSVYYHHIPVGLETMLLNFFEEAPEDFQIPAAVDRYLETDDVALHSALRRSTNPWARRITARKAFRRVLELNAGEGGELFEAARRALVNGGIEHFASDDAGVLSKYYAAGSNPRPIYVADASSRRFVPIQQYSPIYERYAQAARLRRLYVRPDQEPVARALVEALL